MTPIRRAFDAFTLTETAIVLSILGMVLVGIWAAYNAINDSNQANRNYTILTELSHNIRTIYGNQAAARQPRDGDDNRPITLTLINNSAFPPDLRVNDTGDEDTSRAVTQWGVNLFVQLIPPGGLWGFGPGYAINYVGLSVPQCIRLAQNIVQNRDENTVWLRINDDTSDYNLSDPATTPDENAISTRCRTADPALIAVGMVF